MKERIHTDINWNEKVKFFLLDRIILKTKKELDKTEFTSENNRSIITIKERLESENKRRKYK